MTQLSGRKGSVVLGVIALSLAIGFAQAQLPRAVKFKIVNEVGTSVRVRLVHFGASFVTDIAKDKEYVSRPGEALLTGERAVIVFDNPTGEIIVQGQKAITADVKIVLKKDSIDYKAY